MIPVACSTVKVVFVFVLVAFVASTESARKVHFKTQNNLHSEECPLRSAFLPNILEQLAPWLGGIKDQHIEAGVDILRVELFQYNFDGPDGFAKYNETLLDVLSPDDSNFPWSTANFLKVVCIDNTWYLPAGKIPPNPDGNSFLAPHGGYAQMLRDLISLSTRHTLPDMVLLFSSGDFPIVFGPSKNGFIPPVFHSSGDKRGYDLQLPDSYPEKYMPELMFDTEWPKFVENHSLPWNERKNVAVGRYNNMCPRADVRNRTGDILGCPRVGVHALRNDSRNQDLILDAGMVSYPDSPVPYMNWTEQFKYKYYLNLDGATVAFRLPYMFAGGWTILNVVTSPLYSWFSHLLKPWVHYVPFAYDSYDELFDVITFLNKNSELAENIAKKGQEFAREYLTRPGRDCYTLTLLQEYKKLLKVKVGKLSDYPNAILLEDGLREGEKDIEHWVDWWRAQEAASS